MFWWPKTTFQDSQQLQQSNQQPQSQLSRLWQRSTTITGTQKVTAQTMGHRSIPKPSKTSQIVEISNTRKSSNIIPPREPCRNVYEAPGQGPENCQIQQRAHERRHKQSVDSVPSNAPPRHRNTTWRLHVSSWLSLRPSEKGAEWRRDQRCQRKRPSPKRRKAAEHQ